MKTPILGLRTTIYKVSDIDKAKDWYTQAFQTSPYFDEPFYVGFNIGGYELGLQPSAQSGPKTDAVVSYWGSNDIDSDYNHFLSIGAKVHEAPQNVGGEIVVATITDPWNNVIGLIYNPEFKLS